MSTAPAYRWRAVLSEGPDPVYLQQVPSLRRHPQQTGKQYSATAEEPR